jgi:octaheme c-type cytochrome (tetrathionate reductase family)
MHRRKPFLITTYVPALCLVLYFWTAPALALEPHKNIKGLFNTTRDVSIKCLGCHPQQAEEVLKSTHWTWKRQRTVNGKETMFGKKDSLAGFAIDIASNPSRCFRCHISSNPGVDAFEKAEPADIDCLVCHDTTGKYTRNPASAGLEQDDFENIARNVGRPRPGNCTTCHFADCGLSASSPEKPDTGDSRYSPGTDDIHMAPGRASAFTCQTCHVNGSGHSFSRAMLNDTDLSAGRGGCSSCHTNMPHQMERLNSHAEVISCRTCHIPVYAAKTPSVMNWNWLLTGKTVPVFQTVPGGRIIFQDHNGFTTSTMIQPIYMWDDGGDLLYSRGRRIRPQELTYLQQPSQRSSKSKISPFRIIHGTQLYDTKYRYLISPLLSTQGDKLFPDADWNTIAEQGMKAIVLPYSGQYGVAPTVAFRRINHGVVPAGNALGCMDCHGRDSRMNWDALGYDQDPWSVNGKKQPEKPVQMNGLRQEKGILPPAQGTQIFPDPAI